MSEEIVYTYNKYTASYSEKSIDTTNKETLETKLKEKLVFDVMDLFNFQKDSKKYYFAFLYKTESTSEPIEAIPDSIYFCCFAANKDEDTIDDIHIWKCTTGDTVFTMGSYNAGTSNEGFFTLNSSQVKVLLFGFDYTESENVKVINQFLNPGKSFFLEGEHTQAIDLPAGAILKDSN